MGIRLWNLSPLVPILFIIKHLLFSHFPNKLEVGTPTKKTLIPHCKLGVERRFFYDYHPGAFEYEEFEMHKGHRTPSEA